MGMKVNNRDRDMKVNNTRDMKGRVGMKVNNTRGYGSK